MNVQKLCVYRYKYGYVCPRNLTTSMVFLSTVTPCRPCRRSSTARWRCHRPSCETGRVPSSRSCGWQIQKHHIYLGKSNNLIQRKQCQRNSDVARISWGLCPTSVLFKDLNSKNPTKSQLIELIHAPQPQAFPESLQHLALPWYLEDPANENVKRLSGSMLISQANNWLKLAPTH